MKKRLLPLLLSPIFGFAQGHEQNYSIPHEYISTAPVISETAPSTIQDSIFTVAEIPPSFPGGAGKLQEFYFKTLKYPQEMVEQGIEGNVFVKFIIHSNGKLGKVEVLRSPHPMLSNEAIRIVKLMPDWIPAQTKGKAVPMYYTLPIRFKLQ